MGGWIPPSSARVVCRGPVTHVLKVREFTIRFGRALVFSRLTFAVPKRPARKLNQLLLQVPRPEEIPWTPPFAILFRFTVLLSSDRHPAVSWAGALLQKRRYREPRHSLRQS
jgi:hypothetical protein